MQTELIFTILGEDRPGLIELLADRVVEFGGSWMESSMSRLGGQFAGIVRIQASRDDVSAIQGRLEELEASHKLSITLFSADTSEKPLGKRASLSLLGHDRKGIVLNLTQNLAKLHVNVEELETRVEPASMDGQPMFKARAVIHLPDGCSIESVTQNLESIAGDIMVDINILES